MNMLQIRVGIRLNSLQRDLYNILININKHNNMYLVWSNSVGKTRDPPTRYEFEIKKANYYAI